jgi:hypothetical protein
LDFEFVSQNHVQQGIMDFQFSVVFDKAQFAEFVHEKADARSCRADHLSQRFLTDLSTIGLLPGGAKLCYALAFFQKLSLPLATPTLLIVYGPPCSYNHRQSTQRQALVPERPIMLPPAMGGAGHEKKLRLVRW